MNKLYVAGILGVSFLLASCERGEPIKPTIDRTGKEVTVTVYLYNTQEDVTAIYAERHNLSKGEVEAMAPRKGFSMWPEWRDKDGKSIENPAGRLTCEVHSVRPKTVDDDATMTLGHELTHCLYGTYHKDKE
jgi:hypothetical protein